MLTCSTAICLLLAGHEVTLLTADVPESTSRCQLHYQDLRREGATDLDISRLAVVDRLPDGVRYQLAIVFTNEDLDEKKAVLARLEELLPPTATIAINAESIPLDLLQEGTRHPERIVGANWVEPVHTTCFLELISNDRTSKDHVEWLYNTARDSWKKDPYLVSHGSGIRQRMMSALVREAFYLVENGYASVEDIDRACRNDAGYYLAFAGNCRYMDLMGTYAYGMVMKDLNKELSNDQQVAPFFTAIMESGKLGMANNAGFYNYQEGEREVWDKTFREFTYQIQHIMERYPNSYKEEKVAVANTNH